MEFIFLGGVLFIVFIVLALIKFGVETSVKVTAFAFDFVILGLFCIYFFYGVLSNFITDGKLVWFLNIVITIGILVVYARVMVLINAKLPTISKVVNYVISLLGGVMAVRLIIYFVKSFLSIFKDGVIINGNLTFFDSNVANTIIQFIFAVILSVIIFNKRMNLMTNFEER